MDPDLDPFFSSADPESGSGSASKLNGSYAIYNSSVKYFETN